MNIDYIKKNLLKEENIISYKYSKDDKSLHLEVGLYTDKFKEYQKNLFNEFYSSIIDIFEKNDVFLDLKRELEEKIKQFNMQLKVFQEKTNVEEKIEIRGSLQVVYDNYYLSTLIGESTIIIFRNNKLEIVVPNEVEDDDKIDIFSEIIEGELENNDEIISTGCNIYNYMTDNEIKELINNDEIIENLTDILSVRINIEEIGFITYIKVKIEKIFIPKKKELNLDKYKDFVTKNKYAIGLIIGFGIIFFIIISIFLYLGKNDDKAIIQIGNQKVPLRLRDIQRDVAAFSKFNTENTEQKLKKYNKIMNELNLYEKSGIQELEIKNMKIKMEQSYYKGFHINIITENDGILDTIYTFKENELKDLNNIKGIIKENKGINIYGDKGAIIGIINEKSKGTIQKINIPTNIKSCINDLFNNGLYCILDNNDIYSISKHGAKTLTNTNNNWPENIISLGTYGKNRLYTLHLSKNLNNKGTYIRRFTHKRNNEFSNSMDYIFKDKNIAKNIYTGSSLAINGSFLIWSKTGLLQATNESGLKYNIKELKGWEQGIINKDKDYKGKVKIIAYQNNKYIYLYDTKNKTLVVYKKNETGVKYEFKIKIMLNNEKVKDITVDNKNTNQNAYIVTDKKIYKVNLSQFKYKGK